MSDRLPPLLPADPPKRSSHPRGRRSGSRRSSLGDRAARRRVASAVTRPGTRVSSGAEQERQTRLSPARGPACLRRHWRGFTVIPRVGGVHAVQSACCDDLTAVTGGESARGTIIRRVDYLVGETRVCRRVPSDIASAVGDERRRSTRDFAEGAIRRGGTRETAARRTQQDE